MWAFACLLTLALMSELVQVNSQDIIMDQFIDPCYGGCQLCDKATDTCSACRKGFVLNTLGRCDSCPNNCLSCSGANTCVVCVESYAVLATSMASICVEC